MGVPLQPEEKEPPTMSQTVTLTLPDSVCLPIQRAAQATNQPIEDLPVQASLPLLDSCQRK